MVEQTVEDRLREEYFDLLPEIQRVLDHLEAEVKYRLLPVRRKLAKFERVDVSSRIKDCQSAIESLRRRQEGAIFYPRAIQPYSLANLKDLAGIRILAFPRNRIKDVDEILKESFPKWTADPVLGDKEETLALKYWGLSEASSQVFGEYQITSVLTGLFWNVEHSAIYKPLPQLKGVARSLEMQERSRDVLAALKAFDDEFEGLVRSNSQANFNR